VATVTERLEAVLQEEAPVWGVQRVPAALRRLTGLDLAVLWGDLSIGLLVLVSGALLVPALGLRTALLAIVVGTIIGCLPLALVGLAGAREGAPAMVLFRPVLGVRGSWLPSAANFAQLVGWTSFELWAMGRVANTISVELFGLDAPLAWLGVVAVASTLLALAGPIFTVRRWLERFGVWIVAAVAVWLSVRLLTAADLSALWARPGAGGLPFWLAVDIVVAMPVSWLPLVADYNRFARTDAAVFSGAYVGYAIGNAWFYALGALLALAAGSGADVLDVGTTIAATAGGGVVLLVLLVGESDQAMANVYSGAVTAQNVRPAWPQRPLVVAIGVTGFLVAALIGDDAAASLESFLFLIGSIFVPLAAVFLADWGVRAGGHYGEAALFDEPPPGIRARALVPWVAGFLVFQWCAPTTAVAWWSQAMDRVLNEWLGLPFPLLGGAAGGSLPGFATAFVVALAVLSRRPRGSSAIARRRRDAQ
jgi:putative hydroxymethylpyrimidine transporter CytX